MVNWQRIRSVLAELSPQNNAVPRAIYWIKFSTHRIKAVGQTFDDGFSVVVATLNRKEFLSCAVSAVVSSTRMPFELIIIDNASDDGTTEMCQMLQARHPGVVRHVRLKRNIGTNAYALGFLQAKYKYLVCMDDDILALSEGWDRAVIDAFSRIPRLGFLAMNVVQDKYTDGAKKNVSEYYGVTVADTTVEIGPTGAWFAVTTRTLYNKVGGFIFRPYKPYHLHDGKYYRKISKRNYVAGILKKVFVYHACGPYWAASYGYHKMWEVKYQRSYYRDFLQLIQDVQVDEVPSVQYAQAMLIKAEARVSPQAD